MIGHSRCSYVNEHLVAPAGPAVEPGLRLELPGFRFTEGAEEARRPWTVLLLCFLIVSLIVDKF